MYVEVPTMEENIEKKEHLREDKLPQKEHILQPEKQDRDLQICEMMMTTWAKIFLKTMRKTTTIEKIYYVEFK